MKAENSIYVIEVKNISVIVEVLMHDLGHGRTIGKRSTYKFSFSHSAIKRSFEIRMKIFQHLLYLLCILLQSASVVAFTTPSSNLSKAFLLQSTIKTDLSIHSHAEMKEKMLETGTDEDKKNLSIALFSTRLYEMLNLNIDELIDMEDLKVFLDSISTGFIFRICSSIQNCNCT